MPRVKLDPENKSKSSYDYPRLSLDRGERARIVCIESEPAMEWTHVMRAPQIVNGQVVMETVQNRDGTTREAPKFDFIGRHICIGDDDVIADKGVDIKGCPVCLASTESDAVKAPERRFAMHVVRYKTQPGSFTVATPFQVELLAWAFADNRFNTLVDFAAEWGDLRKHDIMLGPCESKQFQKWDMSVAAKAEWLLDDDRKKLVTATFEENKAKDLESLIGRRLTLDQVTEDLQRVMDRHAQAFGGAPVDLPEAEVIASDMELDSLLGTEAKSDDAPVADDVAEPAEAEKKPEVEMDLDDLLSDLG